MVSARSIPRPAYIAAQRPAGPAPTMMTSYVLGSGIGSEFQSRRIPLPRQGARELRAKRDHFVFDHGERRPRELLQRPGAHYDHAVTVAPGAVQQRGGGLDEPLKDPGFILDRKSVV